MDHSAFESGAGSGGVPAGANWISLYPLLELLRSIESRRQTKQFAIETVNDRPVGPAQPDRAFDYGFKHRVEIKRRVADDLEHFDGGGLLLQRFRKIVGALAQFVEQPRVLDSDDGLIGKVSTSSTCLSVNGLTSSL